MNFKWSNFTFDWPTQLHKDIAQLSRRTIAWIFFFLCIKEQCVRLTTSITFFSFFIKWHQEKRNDSSNCQWNPGGMLQLQWAGLRAPSVPETITHWSHGLHRGNEISKMDGNSIASFVLTEHRSDLSVLLLQIWQWLLISSGIVAITVRAVDDVLLRWVIPESTMHWPLTLQADTQSRIRWSRTAGWQPCCENS